MPSKWRSCEVRTISYPFMIHLRISFSKTRFKPLLASTSAWQSLSDSKSTYINICVQYSFQLTTTFTNTFAPYTFSSCGKAQTKKLISVIACNNSCQYGPFISLWFASFWNFDIAVRTDKSENNFPLTLSIFIQTTFGNRIRANRVHKSSQSLTLNYSTSYFL